MASCGVDRSGVDASEKPPFLKQFHSPGELASAYNDYVFKAGSEEDQDDVDVQECCDTATQDINGNGNSGNQLSSIKELIVVTIGETSEGGGATRIVM